jgi:hypothetical protein
MNDLELCKAIAKIEGIGAVEEVMLLGGRALIITPPDTGNIYAPTALNIYAPLTDKELLFNLMVKYEVEADFDEKEVVIYVYTTEGNPILKKFRESFTDKEDIKVAILKVIIKAYGEPE